MPPAAPVPETQTPYAPATYYQVTRTATYGFLLALPLLVLYEALILFVNEGAVVQVRVGAEVWLKRVLATMGGTGLHVMAAVVLLIGLAILYAERRKHIPMRARYFGWAVAESAVYAVLLAVIVSGTVGLLFAIAPVAVPSALPALVYGAPQEPGFGARFALSLGAGLYEELLFRVLLVGGLYAVLRRVLTGRTTAYVAAAVAGALLFSAVHYTGMLGDVFTLPSFTYRFLFGLALNVVFLLRGFGVAAWTHALYDVMVVTHLLG